METDDRTSDESPSFSTNFLRVVDSTLCMVLFFPAMVLYWRGIRDLFSVLVFPDDPHLSDWTTFAIGCLTILGYFLHPLLDAVLSDDVIVRAVTSRAYMFVYGVALMAYWRGLWNLADLYLADCGWVGGLVGLVVCYGGLVALRVSRTVVFPPFVVTLDTRADVLVPVTLLHTPVQWSCLWSVLVYVIDAILTHYVVTTLTILSWRSIFAIYDPIMTSFGDVSGDVMSLVAGILACSALFALDDVQAKLALNLDGTFWRQLMWQDAVVFAIFLSEALLWRGAWNLDARYLLPDRLVGGTVSFVVGSLLLLSFQLISYVGACGCAVDGPRGRRETYAAASEPRRVVDEYRYPTQYLRRLLLESRDEVRRSSDVRSPGSEEREPLLSRSS